jgi:hypothetical protein
MVATKLSTKINYSVEYGEKTKAELLETLDLPTYSDERKQKFDDVVKNIESTISDSNYFTVSKPFDVSVDDWRKTGLYPEKQCKIQGTKGSPNAYVYDLTIFFSKQGLMFSISHDDTFRDESLNKKNIQALEEIVEGVIEQ